VEEQKSKMLTKQLELINGITGPRQEEVRNLKMQRDEVDKVNAALQRALEDSNVEMDNIRQSANSSKKSWWPF
jgi:hypothetical protein